MYNIYDPGQFLLTQYRTGKLKGWTLMHEDSEIYYESSGTSWEYCALAANWGVECFLWCCEIAVDFSYAVGYELKVCEVGGIFVLWLCQQGRFCCWNNSVCTSLPLWFLVGKKLKVLLFQLANRSN